MSVKHIANERIEIIERISSSMGYDATYLFQSDYCVSYLFGYLSASAGDKLFVQAHHPDINKAVSKVILEMADNIKKTRFDVDAIEVDNAILYFHRGSPNARQATDDLFSTFLAAHGDLETRKKLDKSFGRNKKKYKEIISESGLSESEDLYYIFAGIIHFFMKQLEKIK